MNTLKSLFAILVMVLMSQSLRAETRIDLGDMELDTEYQLQDFKNYIGRFTAPRSGVVTCTATTTDVMYPYKQVLNDMYAKGNAYDVTMNSLYGSRSYDFTVEEGQTYIMYANFIMNSNTVFKMTMATPEIKLESTTPAEGAEFSISNGGQVSFDFDKSVTISGATLSVGDNTTKVSAQTYYGSVFFETKNLIWKWYNEGKVAAGDEVTVTLTGVAMASDKSVLYNGDGVAVLHFKLAPLPIHLVSAENVGGKFLSYYTASDDRGLLRFHFSDKVSTSKLKAQIKYGSIDLDADGDYYVEFLTPTLDEDQTTVTINLQGKRRKAADMVASGTNYKEVYVGLLGVCDEQGNYAYAEGSGSLGSYWYAMPFEEVSTNVVAEFSPANGADLTNTKSIEIWITDEAYLSYDGIDFTYVKDGETKVCFVPRDELTREADPDDPTAAILTVKVPDELTGATDVTLTFRNLFCADGSDVSDILTARYNALVITRTSPIAGSTLESFDAGQTIKIYTNRDSKASELNVRLSQVTTGETLLEGVAPKATEGKGFEYTCEKTVLLMAGEDYRLEVKYQSDGAWSNTDYVVFHGAADSTTVVEVPTIRVKPAPDALYNLAGQKVTAPTKGIVISRGRKVLRRD